MNTIELSLHYMLDLKASLPLASFMLDGLRWRNSSFSLGGLNSSFHSAQLYGAFVFSYPNQSITFNNELIVCLPMRLLRSLVERCFGYLFH